MADNEIRIASSNNRPDVCKDPSVPCDGICVGWSLFQGWVKCPYYKLDTYISAGAEISVKNFGDRKLHTPNRTQGGK